MITNSLASSVLIVEKRSGNPADQTSFPMSARCSRDRGLVNEKRRSSGGWHSIAGRALDDRPFNQLRNEVWSQLGQIALYEILERDLLRPKHILRW